MTDSVWFWLYFVVGFTLCVTNAIGLAISNKRIPKGAEFIGGMYLFAIFTTIFFAWPAVIFWYILGALFAEPGSRNAR